MTVLLLAMWQEHHHRVHKTPVSKTWCVLDIGSINGLQHTGLDSDQNHTQIHTYELVSLYVRRFDDWCLTSQRKSGIDRFFHSRFHDNATSHHFVQAVIIQNKMYVLSPCYGVINQRKYSMLHKTSQFWNNRSIAVVLEECTSYRCVYAVITGCNRHTAIPEVVA
jgi:hypothetical protein